VNKLGEIVFVNDFLRHDAELDVGILRSVEQSVEVEVGEVEVHLPGSRSGKGAVDDELEGLDGSCSCATIADVGNGVSTYCDAGAVRIGLGRSNVTYHSRVGNVRYPVTRDITELDGVHGVGTGHPLCGRLCRVLAHALAQASNFFGVRSVPHDFVLGITTKVSMLQEFACL
jgi:hypothetical protein